MRGIRASLDRPVFLEVILRIISTVVIGFLERYFRTSSSKPASKLPLTGCDVDGPFLKEKYDIFI